MHSIQPASPLPHSPYCGNQSQSPSTVSSPRSKASSGCCHWSSSNPRSNEWWLEKGSSIRYCFEQSPRDCVGGLKDDSRVNLRLFLTPIYLGYSSVWTGWYARMHTRLEQPLSVLACLFVILDENYYSQISQSEYTRKSENNQKPIWVLWVWASLFINRERKWDFAGSVEM